MHRDVILLLIFLVHWREKSSNPPKQSPEEMQAFNPALRDSQMAPITTCCLAMFTRSEGTASLRIVAKILGVLINRRLAWVIRFRWVELERFTLERSGVASLESEK